MMRALPRIRSSITYLKEHRAELFWLWIAYQSVKGILTLSLIWIPLLFLWWSS